MNFATLFIRRPVTTTLIQLAIIIFGIMGYRNLPVSDLPTIDYPDDSGHRRPAGRQPGHDGGRRRDAAREAVLDDSRRVADHVGQQPRRHDDHAAVRARSEHRRGRAGRADRHLAIDAPAAAGHAGAAVVYEGQPGRSADLLPGAQLADAAAVDGGREGGEPPRAAHFDGRRRGAGAGPRRAEVRGAYRRQPAASSRCAASASTSCRRRCRPAARAGRRARSTGRTRRTRSTRRTGSCSTRPRSGR